MASVTSNEIHKSPISSRLPRHLHPTCTLLTLLTATGHGLNHGHIRAHGPSALTTTGYGSRDRDDEAVISFPLEDPATTTTTATSSQRQYGSTFPRHRQQPAQPQPQPQQRQNTLRSKSHISEISQSIIRLERMRNGFYYISNP